MLSCRDFLMWNTKDDIMKNVFFFFFDKMIFNGVQNNTGPHSLLLYGPKNSDIGKSYSFGR